MISDPQSTDIEVEANQGFEVAWNRAQVVLQLLIDLVVCAGIIGAVLAACTLAGLHTLLSHAERAWPVVGMITEGTPSWSSRTAIGTGSRCGSCASIRGT
jgi:hypothetical protein